MTALLIHAVTPPLASDGRKRLWRHPEAKEKASQIGGNAIVKGEPFKKAKFLATCKIYRKKNLNGSTCDIFLCSNGRKE